MFCLLQALPRYRDDAPVKLSSTDYVWVKIDASRWYYRVHITKHANRLKYKFCYQFKLEKVYLLHSNDTLSQLYGRSSLLK